jgi:signal transduction histidine kinase
MRNIFFLPLFLLGFHTINAQEPDEDSLRTIVSRHKGDRAEVDALSLLGSLQQQLDSATWYAQKGLSLSKNINYKKGIADCYLLFEGIYGQQGNFSQAIKYTLDALSIYEDLRDYVGIAFAHGMLQANYRAIGDFHKSLFHAFLSLQIAEAHNVKGTIIFPGHRWIPLLLGEIGQTYVLMNQLDSALLYTKKSLAENELFNGAKWNFPVYLLATIQTMQGSYKPALENYRSAIPLAIQNGFFRDTLQIFSGMSTLFKKTGQLDSAIYYAQMVVHSTNPEIEIKNLMEAVSNLEQIYKLRGNKDSTIKYIELSHNLKDSLFSREKDREVQNISFNEQLKQQEILSAQARYKSKIQLYALAAGLLVLLLIAVILWRNNLQKQRAKIKIEQAYNDLKSTQAQLIQSEKMASLGELTAGIAHEIQNPLNFINNFSEVNTELLVEMKGEIDKGNIDDAKTIAIDVIDNEQKINHHGKRADAIVKGMLQHSRISTGQKELTDINALADEYLRLSYHGMRARDKSFNATLQTDFDSSLGKINIGPQDIGRVLLNLYNNAFYAVSEKKKQQPEGYDSSVSVSTKKVDGKISISVKDNGDGISQKVIEKIFQPFFTTKPTGQGTGLGLSLSYDIIKAHGGEIKVETREGEGAEFIIWLPTIENI